YNPLTGLARQVDDGGLATFTLLVNSSDLAFYETGVDGQADVYYYDPVEDESFAVGVAETDEQVLAVLPDGGCVFSRIGGGGETDLFYFRVGTGVVEIGLDVPAIATLSKSFDGNGSGSQVVFTASNGAVRELYVWNPSNGQTAAIATSSDNVVDGIGDGNEVVYHTIVSASEHDVFCYDIDTQATVTVRNASDIGQVLAVTTGTPAFAVVLGDGDTSTIHAVSLVGSPATTSLAAGGAVSTTVGQLPNGDVVAQRTDGTALGLFDVSGVAWSAPFTGSGLAFAGPGLDDGDFVATIGTGASANLSMWDASATAIVVLSSTAGEDTYQTLTDDATILFTRVVDTNTTADLFSWDGTSETRLTNQDSAGLDHDHTVLAKYAGSR
ncbi:MAG: hypothetical protein KDE27_28730, partial [Planctomycetes bacterium]|nr:hypothetical protein [Planctomycetota bacterium]